MASAPPIRDEWLIKRSEGTQEFYGRRSTVGTIAPWGHAINGPHKILKTCHQTMCAAACLTFHSYSLLYVLYYSISRFSSPLHYSCNRRENEVLHWDFSSSARRRCFLSCTVQCTCTVCFHMHTARNFQLLVLCGRKRCYQAFWATGL